MPFSGTRRFDMPSGTRRFDLHTKRTFMNPQSNRRGSNEETVLSEIGQVGTQFDGFAHQTHGDLFYNCIKVDEVASRVPGSRSSAFTTSARS